MPRVAGRGQGARSSARWEGDDEVWIDHATLSEADLEWLAPTVHLVIWAVRMPDGLLARLPKLESLDYRGGSGPDASFVVGCETLRSLSINQVRGLSDLSSVAGLEQLEYLDLYGLPRVATLPSLRGLEKLSDVTLGSMKGLESLSGLFEAPSLRTLTFIRTVRASRADAETIRDSPTIRRFEWFSDDVPDRIWVPFVEVAALSGDTESSKSPKKSDTARAELVHGMRTHFR